MDLLHDVKKYLQKVKIRENNVLMHLNQECTFVAHIQSKDKVKHYILLFKFALNFVLTAFYRWLTQKNENL